MTAKTRQIFLNLPIDNLDKSVEFFTKLGFEFNPQFTDEKATCMILSDQAYVMLLVKDFFQTFTSKPLVDPATQIQAIIALSAESREEVDELVRTALEAGGTPANEPQDYPFMYSSSFHDLDGHLWEILWMDPAHVEGGC
jgi:uncharacterized protein